MFLGHSLLASCGWTGSQHLSRRVHLTACRWLELFMSSLKQESVLPGICGPSSYLNIWNVIVILFIQQSTHTHCSLHLLFICRLFKCRFRSPAHLQFSAMLLPATTFLIMGLFLVSLTSHYNAVFFYTAADLQHSCTLQICGRSDDWSSYITGPASDVREHTHIVMGICCVGGLFRFVWFNHIYL